MPPHGVLRFGVASSALLLLSACAALPTTGPTAGQIVRALDKPGNDIGMELVDISMPVLVSLAENTKLVDKQIPTLVTLNSLAGGRPESDVVGAGDVLAVGFYEIGVGMFGGQTANGGALYPAAHEEQFTSVPVDRNGSIKLPYIGELQVAGHTTREISSMIEKGYAGRSQSPQALVVLKSNVNSTVYVTGDVRKPGRLELTPRATRLLDAIADAGGPVSQAQDMLVRVSRDGTFVEERLDRIRAGAADDIVLHPGDVVELIKEPQTFSVFGAVSKVTQIPFDQTNLTLAEAVARAGGPNDALANPKAVFLFRYTRSVAGREPIPTIYRLNMMKPQAYFMAQKFAMRDKDIVYVSNANINRISKFVGIITQLASPVIVGRALSQ
jgi:polysaccharide export outer membrane protein